MKALLVLLMLAGSAQGQDFFALQPGAQSSTDKSPPRGNRLISTSQLQLPKVSGLTIRFHLSWLGDGYTDWSFIDSCVNRCRQTGDKYTLLPMGGDVPQPWLHVAEFKTLFAVLQARYGNDPLFVGIHCTGLMASDRSEELHYKPKMPRAAIDGCKALIDAAALRFPNQAKIMATGLPDGAAMQEIIDYGAARCPGRFLVKHNAMKWDTSLSALQNQLIVYAGHKGCLIGFEQVGAQGSKLQACLNKAYSVSKSAGQPITYFAIYPSDLPLVGGLK